MTVGKHVQGYKQLHLQNKLVAMYTATGKYRRGQIPFLLSQSPNVCGYRSYAYSSCNETFVPHIFSYFPHKCQYYCFQLCLLMLLQQSKPQQGVE